MNEVIVLFDGYSNDLGNGKMDANCTCTLILGPKNVIVDTMTAWDKERIINALAARDVLPQDIHCVVCTHSHSDHIGNNNIFTNAVHIVGNCVQNRTIFHELKSGEKYTICDGIEIIQTPGHTYDDVTVYVDSKIDGENVRIAITGDLFEKESDICDPSIWKALGRPDLERIQAKHRLEVMVEADFIIPGHGPMFRVTNHMKKLLSDQMNDYLTKD